MEPKSIEEYQELVKDLKNRLRKSEKKNVELVIKLTEKTKNLEKEQKTTNIDQAVSLNKKATKIQAVFKGFRQRKLFRQQLRRIANSDVKSGIKINTNSTALLEILNAVKKIGMNLEMLFRAADVESKGQISQEEFKLFIKRLNLQKVSQAQINRFLHTVDEDCTGIISKEEYQNCLAAYGVNSETLKGRPTQRTFEQECLLKFAAVLKARDVGPEEVYNFCDIDQSGTVRAAQLAKFISNLSEPFQEKEIRALIQHLDVDNNKKIPRDVFLRELEKASRLAGNEGYTASYKARSPSKLDNYEEDNDDRSPPRRIDTFGKNKEEQSDMSGKKGSVRPKNNLDTPQFNVKQPGGIKLDKDDSKKPNKPIVIKRPVQKDKDSESAADSEVKTLKRIIVKMELEGKPIHQFLEKLLLNLKNPSQGIMATNIKNMLDSDYQNILSTQERTALIKALDKNVNGTVDVFEIKQYFITMSKQSKEKVVTSKLLLITIARWTEAEKRSTEDFLTAYSIQPTKRYALKEFQELFNPMFDLDDETAEEVVAELNDKGTDTVDISKIVQTINSYRGDKNNLPSSTKPTTNTKPEKNQNATKIVEKPNQTNKEEITQGIGKDSDKGDVALKRIIVKMELESKPIYAFLEKFLINMKDSKGINARDLQKQLEQEYANVLTPQEKLSLVKAFDQNTNGTVEFFEVFQFVITMAKQSKEKIISSKLILISIAKLADGEKLATEDFLKKYDIQSTKRYSVPDFQRKFESLFDVPDLDEVYAEFNDKGTGTVDVASLIKTINSYRSLQINPGTSPQKQSDNTEKKQGGHGDGRGESRPEKEGEQKGVFGSLPENVKKLLEVNIQDVAERDPKGERNDFKKAIVLLELANKPLYQILGDLLLQMDDPKEGLPVKKVKEFFIKETEGILDENQLKTFLFKMDTHHTRTITVTDIRTFLDSNSKITKEMLINDEIILILMAKLAQSEYLTSEAFLEKYGIKIKKKLSLDEFKKKISKVLTVPSQWEEEVFESFNHNGTGFVEVDALIEKLAGYRNDLTEKGTIKSKAVTNLLENAILSAVDGGGASDKAKAEATKNENLLEKFKFLLKGKGIKLFEFFNVASKGAQTVSAMNFKMAFEKAGVELVPADATQILKILDINGTGTLELYYYEMAILDEENIDDYKKKSSPPRTELDVDKDVLQKFNSVLADLEVTPTQFFKNCDKNASGELDLAELACGIKKTLPITKITFKDRIKIMRSLDTKRSGVVTENEFQAALGKPKAIAKPAINILGIIDNEIKAPGSGAPDNITGDNKEELKDAIKKFQSILDDPKYQKNLEQLFKNFDLNNDKIVTREEFLQALDILDTKAILTERQKVFLVNFADKNKNNKIEYDEFLDLVKHADPEEHEMDKSQKGGLLNRILPGFGNLPEAKIKSLAELLSDIDHEKADEQFARYVEKIQITPEDYFKEGCTTIFSTQSAALKRCYEIVKDLEKKGKAFWDDPDFGAKDENDHGELSIYYNEGERPAGYPDPENIYWFRPPEITPDKKPVFLDANFGTNDVIQGEIGDCWLIGGFSVLATQESHITGTFEASAQNIRELQTKEMTDEEAYGMQNGMYPPMFHWLRKYGIYVIRFFKNYEWRYVIMDDKLPCYKFSEDSAPQLVFGKCRKHHEFWVPLLEKAYSKLHNCYEAVIAGYIDDGLTDMTGLVSEKFKLQGPQGFPSTQVGSAEELWKKLLEYKLNNTMMGCSVQGTPGETEHEVTIDDEPVGILKNHAYSIIDIIEIPNPEARNAHKSHRLLRIRNPWGNKEWTGKWSDGSPKLLQHINVLNAHLKERAKKKKIELFDPEADDGTFLMCYKDWRYIYHNLFCCVKFPEEWSGIRFEDKWTPQNSGGTPLKPDPNLMKSWARNPQFIVTINNKKKKDTEVFISLGQHDGRIVRGTRFPFKENINPAVFTVARLKPGEKQLENFDSSRVVKLSAIKEYRENSLDLVLPNGTYAIVPSTQIAGQSGKFFLNIYFECQKEEITITKAGSDLKGYVIQEEEETIMEYDHELKAALKIKTLAIIVEDELEASLDRSRSQSKGDLESMLNTSLHKNEAPSPLIKPTAKSIIKPGKIKSIIHKEFDEQEANKMFNNIMRGIGLSDSDYFKPGCTTILNNSMACLKQCHEILRSMKQNNQKRWIDPEFGPQSPDEPGLEFICEDPEDPPYWVSNVESISWVSIKDIVPDGKKPYFLSNGADSGDVMQGQLGDCWFIGALSVLASNNDAYIRGNFKPTKDVSSIDDEEAQGMTTGVYPPMFHWLRQFGIYVIRFFKNYAWRYVLIDDRLPSWKYPEEPPQVIMGKCREPNEFWVPLIEKAYAKIHNTYESLISGQLHDGLSDMTGLAADKLDIADYAGDRDKIDFLWKMLMKMNMDGTMMGCSVTGKPGEVEHELVVDGERMGILKSHAYSIIDVFELPAPEQQNYHKNHRMLRIRNPWGNKEWQGKWSDASDKFAKNIFKIEKYMREEKIRDPEYEVLDTKATDDGTFLICYKDWRTHFTNLSMSLNFPDEWSGYRYTDRWTNETCGGFPIPKDVKSWAKNPQYILEVTTPTKAFLSLGQFDGRLDRGGKFPFTDKIHRAMIFVMKLQKNEDKIKEYDNARVVKMSENRQYRDLAMFVDFEPGKYAIIPSTKLPQVSGPFFMSVYLSCAKNEFKLSKAGSNLQYEVIVEEEENADHYDDNLKLVLKIKAAEVIYEEEESLVEKTLSQTFD